MANAIFFLQVFYIENGEGQSDYNLANAMTKQEHRNTLSPKAPPSFIKSQGPARCKRCISIVHFRGSCTWSSSSFD